MAQLRASTPLGTGPRRGSSASLLGAEYRQHFREANASLASLDHEIAPHYDHIL